MENLIRMFATLTILIASQLTVTFGAKCVYYGSPGETGEQTATGEPFNPMGMTCSALAHLPFGSILEVRNQINGRVIQVRVNDRFEAPPGEDTIDLTYGAFGLIANHDDGVVPCSYNIISTYQSDSESISRVSNTRSSSSFNINTGDTRNETVTDTNEQVQTVHVKSETVQSIGVPSASTTTTTATATTDQSAVVPIQEQQQQQQQQQQQPEQDNGDSYQTYSTNSNQLDGEQQPQQIQLAIAEQDNSNSPASGSGSVSFPSPSANTYRFYYEAK